jgi:hypothetical protein
MVKEKFNLENVFKKINSPEERRKKIGDRRYALILQRTNRCVEIGDMRVDIGIRGLTNRALRSVQKK